MRDAIAAEAVRLEDLGDDLATIRATGQVFNAFEDAILEIGEPRLRALARLRAQGWSYNRLVEATGLSKTRVAQLVREAHDPRHPLTGFRPEPVAVQSAGEHVATTRSKNVVAPWFAYNL